MPSVTEAPNPNKNSIKAESQGPQTVNLPPKLAQILEKYKTPEERRAAFKELMSKSEGQQSPEKGLVSENMSEEVGDKTKEPKESKEPKYDQAKEELRKQVLSALLAFKPEPKSPNDPESNKSVTDEVFNPTHTYVRREIAKTKDGETVIKNTGIMIQPSRLENLDSETLKQLGVNPDTPGNPFVEISIATLNRAMISLSSRVKQSNKEGEVAKKGLEEKQKQSKTLFGRLRSIFSKPDFSAQEQKLTESQSNSEALEKTRKSILALLTRLQKETAFFQDQAPKLKELLGTSDIASALGYEEKSSFDSLLNDSLLKVKAKLTSNSLTAVE